MTRHHDRGSGPALLIVPGLAATARFLDGAVDDLSADHRVLTLELPGHGERSGDTDPASIRVAAEDVAALLDDLDLHDVTLLGWSLGATVTYAYLELFGAGRVSGLVSVEQTPRLTLAADWPHAAFGGLDAAGATQLMKSIADDFPAFTETLVGSSFAAGAEPAADVRDLLLAEARRCDPAAVSELFADAATDDRRAQLARLAVPTLLIHGARSQVYPTAVGDWLAGTMPSARLETFEASGHLPFVEEPERFTSTVRAFVAGRRNGER